MDIPLVNTCLRIEISRRPKVSKLKKELSDFFSKNDIQGIKIEKFELSPDRGENIKVLDIYPEMHGMRLRYPDSEDNYTERINKIGRKYNVSSIQFALSCYGK